MENPVNEISQVISQLTQGSPSVQRATIEKYFTTNASFQHPFCRTGGFDGSRFLIRAIYRWYKILSPRIDLEVNSVAFDEKNLILYVNISQVFQIWLVPILHAHATLTTVLKLKQDEYDGKYYMTSQEDLYQVNEFLKFLLPGGWIVVQFLQFLATLLCLLGALVFWPISWLEQHGDAPGRIATIERIPFQQGKKALGEGKQIVKEAKDDAVEEVNRSNGEMITAPAIQWS